MSPEPSPRRTALVVCVPAADDVTRAFRGHHLAETVARRLPAHITIVFPFAPADLVDVELDRALARHFGEHDRFSGRLVSVEAFDTHVWLRPKPIDRFVRLIEATSRRFPDHPPYAGEHQTIVPHLTIGALGACPTVEELLQAARSELGAALPVSFEVREVTLLEEREEGTWSPRSAYPLA